MIMERCESYFIFKIVFEIYCTISKHCSKPTEKKIICHLQVDITHLWEKMIQIVSVVMIPAGRQIVFFQEKCRINIPL